MSTPQSAKESDVNGYEARLRRITIALFATSIIANIIQSALSIAFYRLWRREKMMELFLRTESTDFDYHIFKENCIAQRDGYQNYILSNPEVPPIMTGLFPALVGEMSVVIISFAIVLMITWSFDFRKLSRHDIAIGGLVGMGLFFADQVRFYSSSIERIWGGSWMDQPKTFYTWSSYCFSGDYGVLFSIVGYVAMYIALALGISVISSVLRRQRYGSGSDLYVDEKDQDFLTIGRVYSWLPYYSYFGFACWVVGVQIDWRSGSDFVVQIFLITSVLVLVFSACLIYLIRAHRYYDGNHDSRSKLLNAYLDPHGTKCIETLGRIIAPALIVLAIWKIIPDDFLR